MGRGAWPATVHNGTESDTTERLSTDTHGRPWRLSGKESARQGRKRGRRGLDPRVGETPWRRVWQLPPGFLPEESPGQRSLAGYSPWGCRVGHD